MKLRSKLVALVLGVVGALVVGASGAHAEASWDAVKKKIADAKDYSLQYDYDGPNGKFKFEYAFAQPGKIRTKVLRGSDRNVGTVIVYDKTEDPNHVKARVGTGQLVRGLDHKDVKDTPFYQSIWSIILDQTKTGKPVSKAGGNVKGQETTLFEFNGGAYKVWVNNDNDIVKTERSSGGRVTEKREFSKITWNSNPKVDF